MRRAARVVAVACTTLAAVSSGSLLRNVLRHRALRSSLGVFVLNRLDTDERATVLAHLNRCPACRSEVERLAPVATLLGRVDPRLVDWLVREETVVPASRIPLPRNECQPSARDTTTR